MITISKAMSELMFEEDVEEFKRKLEIYNKELRWIAEENDEEFCEQMATQGPALFVYESPIGKN